MNKIINFLKLYLLILLMIINNIKCNNIRSDRSFLYETTKNLKNFTPFVNKYISLENSFLHLLIPILGVYGLFSAIEVLAMHFKIKLPPIIPVSEGKYSWWKIGLTAATLIIQPQWNFYKGFNSFRNTSTPSSLLEDSINNLHSINTKYNDNNPTEKIIIDKISLINKEIESIKNLTAELDNEI